MPTTSKEVSSLKMVYEFGRWVFMCEYEDRHIPKAARFFWDRHRGAWVTTSAKMASGLIMYADKEAKQQILDKLIGPPPLPVPRQHIPPKFGRFGTNR